MKKIQFKNDGTVNQLRLVLGNRNTEGGFNYYAIEDYNYNFSDSPLSNHQTISIKSLFELKEGDDVCGIEFEDGKDNVAWAVKMKDYIGKKGKVALITTDSFKIQFDNNWWFYPISLAYKAKLAFIMQEPTEEKITQPEVKKRIARVFCQHKEVRDFEFDKIDGNIFYLDSLEVAIIPKEYLIIIKN